MESLLIVCDCIALLGLMVWVIQNENRGTGPVKGLFSYRLTPRQKPDAGPSVSPRQRPRDRSTTTARR